jgi:hypothetical protein
MIFENQKIIIFICCKKLKNRMRNKKWIKNCKNNENFHRKLNSASTLWFFRTNHTKVNYFQYNFKILRIVDNPRN